MTAKDRPVSKPATDNYRDNYDRVFGKNKPDDTEYKANEEKALRLGYKYAACLVCGNHDTPTCETCQP